jgi:hypothetical protein
MGKNRNVRNLAKGGVPPIAKKPNYFRFFLVKASLIDIFRPIKKIEVNMSRKGGVRKCPPLSYLK